MNNKIAMDLDYIKYFNMQEEDIREELKILKDYNVSSLIIPYEIFLNKDLKDFKEKILTAISEVGFSLILLASGIRNYTTTFVDDDNLNASVIYHKQFILNTYEMLKENYNLHENMKVIFEGGNSDSNNEAFYLDKAITFFNEISTAAAKFNIDIMIDLVKSDIKEGKVIGDKWQDIRVLCKNITNENFGVRWNMKNSRINASEADDILIPTDDVITRVKLATVVNTSAYEGGRKSFNVEMQFEEIKALIKLGYTGEFNLEYIYSYIQEIGIPYQNVYDSIEYLTYILTFYNNQNEAGLLQINYDMDKMKRRVIRRYFNNNVLIILQTNNYKFKELEISENDVVLISNQEFNYIPGQEHKLIVRVQDDMFELDTMLKSIRKGEDGFRYIFSIMNTDRETRKNLCKFLYLTK